MSVSTIPGLCPQTVPASCVAVPASSLAWHMHGQHSYQAAIRVETVAGHYADIMSEVYVHYYGPPKQGRVWIVGLNGQVRT